MEKERRRFYLITCLIYVGMSFYGFVNSMRGVAYPLLKNDFGISYTQQGFLVFVVSVFSVVTCVAAGIALNRFGFRKTLLFGFAVTLAGMVSVRFASGFVIAAAFLLVMQIGLGCFEISLNGMGVRTFTEKSALMMNLLHFFYGVGAIIGPVFAGWAARGADSGWRSLYVAGAVPVFVMAVFSVIATQKDPDKDGKTGEKRRAKKQSYFAVMKQGNVWLFGLIMGIGSSVEVGTINWSGLYFQDVYGLDPKTAGAAFISVFYILYAVSRFFSGFVIERAGYTRSLSIAVFCVILTLAAGFVLGERGIWVLPLSGLFIAIVYPTMLALSVGCFGEEAQNASGVIIPFSFAVNSLLQYCIGLVNRYAGEQWGFRCCLLYAAALFLLLRLLKNRLRQPTGDSHPLYKSITQQKSEYV
jgi:fucose permease